MRGMLPPPDTLLMSNSNREKTVAIKTPTVNQTAATAAPNTFFFEEAMLEWTKRCAHSLQRNNSEVCYWY